ncbi:hypothetical protein K1T71_013670 [Dendrolimus kikuchii]|uniref:Uncharacterized protein n=1 Tax=Dendrolimus kikuchii TaxID=765133 RepID=A0ACC1CH31_9NEOP|nr:hypothetical protein K1T71_013670 [Dendrolimus kikuchii]
MDYSTQKTQRNFSSRSQWRFGNITVVIVYILLFIQSNCLAVADNTESSTKNDNLDLELVNKDCHSCQTSSNKTENDNLYLEDKSTNVKEDSNENEEETDLIEDILGKLNEFSERYVIVNRSMRFLERKVENLLDKVLSKDSFVVIDGIEIKPTNDSKNEKDNNLDVVQGRALFSKYTYEYRLYQKIKNFINTHMVTINFPKAAQFIAFRSFGLNKFFVPLLIGGQLIFKSILLAMFLPSILGSFGKILGKGISQLSAASSQASYPPMNADTDQTGYNNNENKDYVGYETNQAGTYAYAQDGMYQSLDNNDANEVGNVDMSRYGPDGQKVTFLNSKNSYYKNQMAGATNNYKVFQKIPASSMILSNYDPFYSPLLSRLDGIFARLGLAPSENSIDNGIRVGGQTATEVKLEACREQLICLMYASPAKYAPYSNLVSAQLSRELNELRRPVSDNPEILRFFRYMRAARRGQEGADCIRSFPVCSANAVPAHTMIAAYHDINKLVSARKLKVE